MRTSLFGIAVRTAEVSKKRRGRAWLDVVLTKLRPDSPEVDGIKQDHSVGSAGTGHDICWFFSLSHRSHVLRCAHTLRLSLHARRHSVGVCFGARAPPRNTKLSETQQLSSITKTAELERRQRPSSCSPRTESRFRKSTKRSSLRTKSISSPATVCTR